ncbi:MAG TPA: nicotinate-nucleotide adenylyltransferase [Ignavibacteriaceae bacterium]|nr:nicotinate-nucleotide adenylyltransferase [Ignavibacteriaceae bacterium]
MSKIGVYGGTFDPIHNGHLITAQAVREIRNLDKIIFIPAFVSPHKLNVISSSNEHRLNMINLAIEGVDYLECSDMEIKRKDISYTIDTLTELKKSYKEIELIIGYDNLFKFDTWKNPQEIVKLVKLVVLKRKSIITGITNQYFDKAEFVDTPIIEISGTSIRERVKNNMPIDFLVPDKVKQYIYKNNLYKESD